MNTTDQTYTLHLTLGGKIYTGQGKDLVEALGNLERPQKIMLKSILTVTHGNTKKQLSLTPVRAKRLFLYSHGMREVNAKILQMAMK